MYTSRSASALSVLAALYDGGADGALGRRANASAIGALSALAAGTLSARATGARGAWSEGGSAAGTPASVNRKISQIDQIDQRA